MLTFTVIGILAILSHPALWKFERLALAAAPEDSADDSIDNEFEDKVPVRIEDRSDRDA